MNRKPARNVNTRQQDAPCPVQLDLPGFEHLYFCPSPIIRSALFAPLNRQTKRRSYNNQELASYKGVSVVYTGEQLGQSDLDVFQQAICLSGGPGFGARVFVNESNFLKAIGRATGGANRKWLHKAFDRLLDGKVVIQSSRYKYVGHLIDSYCQDEQTGNYFLRLNPELAPLFDSGFTAQAKILRNSLKGERPKWTYTYLRSHSVSYTKPHVVNISTLHDISGSPRDLRKYTYDLPSDLNHIRDTARHCNCGRLEYKVENRKLAVFSVPS